MLPRPVVTVIIPARNAAWCLPDQLSAMSRQDFEGEWELVIADNGSSDGTAATAGSYLDRIPHLRVVDAGRGLGVAFARNVGACSARGDHLVFCDADDVASPSWLRHFVAEGSAFDIAYGRGHMFRGSPPSRADGDTLNLESTLLSSPFNHLPFGSGGNLMVRRFVFDALHGFDQTLRTGEDVDFCWRAQYAGFILGSSPRALMHFRERPSGQAQFRQYYNYGRSEPHLYERHHSLGMPRSSSVRAIAVYGWIAAVGLACLARRNPFHRNWVNSAGRRLGRVVGSCELGHFYL